MSCQGRLAPVIPVPVGREDLRARKRRQHIVEDRRHDLPAVPDRVNIILVRARVGEIAHVRPGQLLKKPRLREHDAFSVHILKAAAAADDQRAPIRHILLQNLRPLLTHDERMRVDQHFVGRKLCELRLLLHVYNIVRRMVELGSRKDLLLARRRDPAVPDVRLRVKDVVVVLEEREAGCIFRPADRVQGLHFGNEILHLRELPIVPSIVIKNSVPVHLRPERTCAPAEEGNEIRPLRHRLHRPERKLARPRRGHLHAARPAASARLLLHDAEMRADRPRLGEVPGPFAVV